MSEVNLTIDGRHIQVPAGTTILEAARRLGIYIPALCNHPDLPPAAGSESAAAVFQGTRKLKNALPEEKAKGCGLCVVEIEGDPDLAGSCVTDVAEGMVVITLSDRIQRKRRENLLPILARHRHACLTCAQQEGCSRTQCSSNVPENERCCDRFGHCELQDVANHVGILLSTPKWVPTDLPILKDAPLFVRDYSLCIGCTRCVRVCRDLRGIEAIGYIFDASGEVQVGTLAPTPAESGCRFCTACVEVCPTGALTDKSVRAGKREDDIVPCRAACPVHIDVPGYLRLVADGRRAEADAVIREKVPFPGVLGRVCIHPCEEACRRGEVNEPISICAIKRHAADGGAGFWKRSDRTEPATGKKAAVVGAGPAGLTAAFYLRKLGHAVTVFDSRDKAGGMMRYGIPPYRLPREVLDREIRDVLDVGIDFKPNRRLGRDFTLDQLQADGYDAVFLGVGAQRSRRIAIEGSDHADVLWGIDFLNRVAAAETVAMKEKVIVIGGGNVAVDAARTALRCGAGRVTLACPESREQMPACAWEIDGALAEGVRLLPSWGTRRILTRDGRVSGVELVACSRVVDERGNFCPAFGDATKTVDGDQVIMAVGQASDLSFFDEGGPVAVTRGWIVVDERTMETGKKGVFAGGDAVAAPGAVIHAIAAGRRAASAMDRALGGKGDIDEVLFERGAPEPRLGRDEGFALRSRQRLPELDPRTRCGSFDEVALGYDEGGARREAGRCLQCDLRLYMGRNPSPPGKMLAFNRENVALAPGEEGVYRLFDEERAVVCIKGTPELRQSLLEALRDGSRAAFFDVETDKMYSRRESELIRQHLQEHGEMPGGGADDLEDLF